MQLGEEKTLADSGAYQNEVTCTSTDGQTWYLKVNLLQPLSSGAETIPLEAFRWQLVSSTGNGTAANAFQPRAFSLTPDLIYLSGPSDASGSPVRLQLKYILKIPEAQVRGVYQTTIRFTLTEML